MAETFQEVVTSGVAGDTVIYETSPDNTYSGTWSPAITLSAPSSLDSVTDEAVRVVGKYGRVRVTNGGSPTFTQTVPDGLGVYTHVALSVVWASGGNVAVTRLLQVGDSA